MESKDLLRYNLLKISSLDKELEKINKQKNSYIEHNEKKYDIYEFLTNFQASKIQFMMIISISLFVYSKVSNFIIGVILSCIIVALYNSVVCILIKKFMPDSNYSSKIEEYNKNINELLIKRNTHINLYKYALDGDKAIYDNIRLKVNNEKSYEYEKNIDILSLDKNSYEFITLNEMKNKEKKLITSIKNKIYFELRRNKSSENLSKEQLKLIDMAL